MYKNNKCYINKKKDVNACSTQTFEKICIQETDIFHTFETQTKGLQGNRSELTHICLTNDIGSFMRSYCLT